MTLFQEICSRSSKSFTGPHNLNDNETCILFMFIICVDKHCLFSWVNYHYTVILFYIFLFNSGSQSQFIISLGLLCSSLVWKFWWKVFGFWLKSLFNDHSFENVYLTRLFFTFLSLPSHCYSFSICWPNTFLLLILWRNLQLKQREGLINQKGSMVSPQLRQILKCLWSLQQEAIWSTCTEHLFLIINAAPGSF